MTDKVENVETQADDSLDYEQSQIQLLTQAQAELPVDDPLAAVKAMRLQQLAVCRLKTAAELQAMRDKLVTNSAESTEDETG